jgi:uncharacterized protein (DUF1501 family)
VLGGGIKGGRIAGDQVRVTEANLFQDRDYPVLNEYRSIIGGLLSPIYGLEGDRLQTVFANTTPKDIRLV